MAKITATIEDLRQLQDKLAAKFGSDANVAYANVSMTQLSTARRYGGARVNGKHYVYNPMDDSLIREDVVKWVARQKKLPRSLEKDTHE